MAPTFHDISFLQNRLVSQDHPKLHITIIHFIARLCFRRGVRWGREGGEGGEGGREGGRGKEIGKRRRRGNVLYT